MNTHFKSGRQETLFNAVLSNLQQLGYRGELLKTDYAFVDWFQPDRPERVVPAAAFGQTPQAYDSACFAVLLSNGKFGPELVADCRALGAPYAFEVREDLIINWRVGPDAQAAKELLRIEPDRVDRIFQDHREAWAGGDILRTKGIGFKLGPRQLDFIDLGLIPALEQQISAKLDRVLKELVQKTVQMLKVKRGSTPEQLRALYRLIFRFLAAKVLHDRGVPPFWSYDQDTPRRDILDAVAKYYGEDLTVTPDQDVQDAVATHIWTELDFRNLSVEVLAYIYENTFVDPEARKKLGTHRTPHSIARYIVHHIPFERLDQNHRQTLEPFCGHGVFSWRHFSGFVNCCHRRWTAKRGTNTLFGC
jgi:hypothetical protein